MIYTPSHHTIQGLMSLFKGYQAKIGQTRTKDKNSKGKLEAQCYTIDGPPSMERWERHLQGHGPGIGIVPLCEDGTVLWACIDVDCYPIDHVSIEQRIKALEIPLYVFRSKSGGAHLMAFFSSPVPASKAIKYMQRCEAQLGLSGCEIFPKQAQRRHIADIGNWLNMPYYGGMEHGRYAIIDGNPVTPKRFLEEIGHGKD